MDNKKFFVLCILVVVTIIICLNFSPIVKPLFPLVGIKNISHNEHNFGQTLQNSISTTFSFDVIHYLPNIVIDNGPNKTVHHIISAYFDSRKLPNRPAIIMFGYVQKRLRKGNLHCALVYEDNSTKCTNLTHHYLHEPKVLSELYLCKMSVTDKIPTHVVLTEEDNCEISNESEQIPVWNTETPEMHYDIGVCVESPLFTSSSVTNQKLFDRMVEFMAMVKVLGAQIVTVYNWNLKKELVMKILKLYPEFIDMVHWEKITVNLHYYGQNVMLWDCLYRNMNRVKYLAFIDLDEIIFPLSNYSWMDMLKTLEKEGKYAGFRFQNMFMAEVRVKPSTMAKQTCPYLKLPKFFVRWQRLPWHRYPPERTKVIVKPELVSAVCVHNVCHEVMDGYKYPLYVNNTIGVMFHYRIPMLQGLGKGVEDRTALKYKDQVMQEMKRVCSLIHT